VSENIPNIDFAAIEVDGCDQAIFIASNVENE
jgi:hypothetical protein